MPSATQARSNGSAPPERRLSTSALSQYRRLGSKKITGSSEAIACWIMANASAGSEQATTLRPAVWAKNASGDSLWCSTAPMPPPNGMRITIGRGLPAGPVAHLRELADDLVVRRVDEAVELDLADRPVAAQGQADRRADDAGLGERGVDDAVLAEVLLQAVGDPEDAAELADVLAHDQDLGVVLQRPPQTHVERRGQGELVIARSRFPPRSCPGRPRTGRARREDRGLLGVDVVEHGQRLRVGHGPARLAEPGAELVGLRVDLVEEVLVGQAVALQVDLDAGDRVLEPPGLELAGQPVPGRVVGGGVRAHAVGVGLDERRALAVAGRCMAAWVTA